MHGGGGQSGDGGATLLEGNSVHACFMEEDDTAQIAAWRNTLWMVSLWMGTVGEEAGAFEACHEHDGRCWRYTACVRTLLSGVVS
eukprot:352361-Chlamydomonas_euryale.AAC.2